MTVSTLFNECEVIIKIKYFIMWQALKLYGKFNIFIEKCYKFKNQFCRNDIIDIHIISNGYEKIKKIKSICDPQVIPCDFIYYEFDKEDEELKYMVFTDKLSKNLKNIEKSNVRFLVPQLKIKDSLTLIEFTHQNIYLVNNIIFSRPFIQWYMNEFHSYFVNNNQDYLITFFDDKMDAIEINGNQCIVLEKDTYKIINYTKKSESESESDLESEQSLTTTL